MAHLPFLFLPLLLKARASGRRQAARNRPPGRCSSGATVVRLHHLDRVVHSVSSWTWRLPCTTSTSFMFWRPACCAASTISIATAPQLNSAEAYLLPTAYPRSLQPQQPSCCRSTLAAPSPWQSPRRCSAAWPGPPRCWATAPRQARTSPASAAPAPGPLPAALLRCPPPTLPSRKTQAWSLAHAPQLAAKKQ